MSDVVACYHLLLGRLPDSEGLRHYEDRVSAGELSVGALVEEFLASVEFGRGLGARLTTARGAARPTEVVATCEGFSLHVDPTDYAVGHTIARTGSYEPEVSAAVRHLLRPAHTFVDIGANMGWFSLLAASAVGPTGRVLAIEPNPLNVALLHQSAKDNGFNHIEAVCVALSEAPGVVALETDGSNGRVIPVTGPPPEPVEASFVVASRPLDAVLAEAHVERVDVMKIDVEGAEPLVLAGGTQTIERDQPVIVSEFYPLALDCAPWGSARSYLQQLRDLGYTLYVIGPDGLAGPADDKELLELAGALDNGHIDVVGMPRARQG